MWDEIIYPFPNYKGCTVEVWEWISNLFPHFIGHMISTDYLSMLGFNSLAPGKFKWNFRHVIFKQILVIDGWGISCEIALIWMSLDFTDDQLTLVQVLAWCHQATSHYLNQCWPRFQCHLASLGPNELIPAWINNYIYYKMWDEIIYPFPNYKGCTVDVWEWISNLFPHFIGHMISTDY